MLSIKRAYQEVDLVVSSDPRSGKEAPSWGYFSSEDADAYYKNPGIKTPPPVLAKLGWELAKDELGCWRTERIDWHDFRDQFRPGWQQEEWPRICG